MLKSTHILIMTGFGAAMLFFAGHGAYAEEQWYENLESSSISYPVDVAQTQQLDKKAIEADLNREISKPREELTSWQNSTQMMIKPSRNG